MIRKPHLTWLLLSDARRCNLPRTISGCNAVCFLPPKGGFGLVGKAKIGLALAKTRLQAKL